MRMAMPPLASAYRRQPAKIAREWTVGM
jgi:hypothetical protein